jgi:hypothetical protein
VEYLRLWETSQLKRPTEELKPAICLSLNAEMQLRKERRIRRSGVLHLPIIIQFDGVTSTTYRVT